MWIIIVNFPSLPGDAVINFFLYLTGIEVTDWKQKHIIPVNMSIELLKNLLSVSLVLCCTCFQIDDKNPMMMAHVNLLYFEFLKITQLAVGRCMLLNVLDLNALHSSGAAQCKNSV